MKENEDDADFAFEVLNNNNNFIGGESNLAESKFEST